ncbi:MAG: SIS domain-containing protein [Candidatus Bipolaricaulis sp.]|jgi:D-sedoheptulose 7-phosphate isomerase|nr:SIS domain-containing protein [Candidatus Bipolaricaulis sp.]
MKIAEQIIEAFKKGNKLLIAGNGGSAAESQHMAGELIGKFTEWHKPLPAIALTTDTSVLTAMGNDVGFEYVFERQVRALGRAGDVLLLISTSGKSLNLLRAADVARELGMEVIELPRKGKNTPQIQEKQLVLIHKICAEIERSFL